MKNKKTIAALGVFILALVGVGTTVFLVSRPSQVSTRAQSNSNSSSSNCPAPAAVTNVKLTYPVCQGGQCDFNSATCSWDPVNGAASYSYIITEVDSGNVVKNSSVQIPTVTVTFPVTQGKTYRCDVNAVNSCGSSGGTGTDTLLCQSNALLTTPTPTVLQPTLPPNAAPTPSPTITPAPTSAVVACGASPCDAAHTCQLGLVCVQAVDGQSYCAQGAFTKACQQTPSVNACCFTQVAQVTPRPTPPPSGNSDGTILVTGVSGVLLLIGGAMLFL